MSSHAINFSNVDRFIKEDTINLEISTELTGKINYSFGVLADLFVIGASGMGASGVAGGMLASANAAIDSPFVRSTAMLTLDTGVGGDNLGKVSLVNLGKISLVSDSAAIGTNLEFGGNVDDYGGGDPDAGGGPVDGAVYPLRDPNWVKPEDGGMIGSIMGMNPVSSSGEGGYGGAAPQRGFSLSTTPDVSNISKMYGKKKNDDSLLKSLIFDEDEFTKNLF